MTDIHRAGRKPINRPPEFYKTLIQQYETMTTREMASVYNVSSSTISVWLRKGRKILSNG